MSKGLQPIKTSRLIVFLEKSLEENGDLPIYLPAEPVAYHPSERVGDEIVCVGVNTWMESGDPDKATSLLLMDPGCADAFG